MTPGLAGYQKGDRIIARHIFPPVLCPNWKAAMKILALEIETPGVESGNFHAHLRQEARRVWELYQANVIRELYFHQHAHTAVLVLECATTEEARDHLSTLPLVKAGLIRFELVPLIPYPGFARLFAKEY